MVFTPPEFDGFPVKSSPARRFFKTRALRAFGCFCQSSDLFDISIRQRADEVNSGH